MSLSLKNNAGICNLIVFLCCRESNGSDDHIQNCVEEYLQVLTSILSEKR